MLKQLLQQLTRNNSESLSELYYSFVNTFPNETGVAKLLYIQIFSENSVTNPDLLITKLKELKGKV